MPVAGKGEANQAFFESDRSGYRLPLLVLGTSGDTWHDWDRVTPDVRLGLLRGTGSLTKDHGGDQPQLYGRTGFGLPVR